MEWWHVVLIGGGIILSFMMPFGIIGLFSRPVAQTQNNQTGGAGGSWKDKVKKKVGLILGSIAYLFLLATILLVLPDEIGDWLWVRPLLFVSLIVGPPLIAAVLVWGPKGVRSLLAGAIGLVLLLGITFELGMFESTKTVNAPAGRWAETGLYWGPGECLDWDRDLYTGLFEWKVRLVSDNEATLLIKSTTGKDEEIRIHVETNWALCKEYREVGAV
ncbi:MAG: hypothetical protein WDZ90_00980 [Candidatus Paceibacterota bacterium]